MDGPYLAELLSYPVKSLAGGSHTSAHVHPWGLAQDRRWMVVDAAARYMTQRECPRMAVVQAAARDDLLVLSAPGLVPLMVSPGTRARAGKVTVSRDTVPAEDCGEIAASWMSAALGLRCRLVHLRNPRARKLGAAYAVHGNESVSFADAFPVLLASETSLADLNARLDAPVPMSRFRPNLVIAAAPAWAEDTWRRVRIGQVVFRVSKPCDRCVVTTIDQQTGLRSESNEPLLTLGRFRRVASGKIMFAQNLVPENTGGITAGDAVEILESGEPNVEKVREKLGGPSRSSQTPRHSLVPDSMNDGGSGGGWLIPPSLALGMMGGCQRELVLRNRIRASANTRQRVVRPSLSLFPCFRTAFDETYSRAQEMRACARRLRRR